MEFLSALQKKTKSLSAGALRRRMGWKVRAPAPVPANILGQRISEPYCLNSSGFYFGSGRSFITSVDLDLNEIGHDSCKEPDSKYLGFMSHTFPVVATQLCHYIRKAAISNNSNASA